MSTYFSAEVQAGIDAARKKAQKQRHRLRVEADGQSVRVLRFLEDGFTLDAQTAPQLRGLVNLYDGSKHLYQCLVIATDEEDGEMHYEFKRFTPASDQAPVDFYRGETVPAGLLDRPN
ncbi:hypothetical protein J7382_03280 [Shimia sp. R11_0]|uniref:Uncharacterized protein n=1 Tax=Shimia marina TaxID=321267 RepID=A0A0P1ETL7_9RHOB|nr:MULTISPECIES: hypothetical protein [Shimia]MBO9476549.1 hypothetical protein [Shimia sp. R11_0]CUH53937.1 hypothetical protein SHM7688_03406 [Shimia marina]SFE18772.1 hypothetical protein SAMN04488037_106104 [Shimia marina]